MDLRPATRQHRLMQQAFDTVRTPEFSWLGRADYRQVWRRMQRQAELLAGRQSGEVVWACEHDAVYTTGRRGVDNRRRAELPAPLLHTDRGGETTFHGPGQLMLYPVLSLQQRGLGVRDYVCLLEHSCIDLLGRYGIRAGQRDGLPGVWVGDAKIAAIGLRVSRGTVWHGMALNVRMDAKWFAPINACGTGLGVTSMHVFLEPPSLADLARMWYILLSERLTTASPSCG
jgi:lipoyl(octanoyl) transferase